MMVCVCIYERKGERGDRCVHFRVLVHIPKEAFRDQERTFNVLHYHSPIMPLR